MKRVYAKEEVCIGCRLCEIACITEHSPSKDVIKTFKGKDAKLISRNQVEEEGPVSFCVTCRHCEEPSCVHVCISGALVKDTETGVVRHISEKCVGCWSCIMACPYGVIKRDMNRGKVIKCDLCPDRETPACVAACPNEALYYGEK